MIIELTEEQARYACMIAENRDNSSRQAGHPDRHGIRDDDGSLERAGACGELAAAIALGLSQKLTVNTFKREPDLVYRGWPVEVKTSRSRRPKLFFRDRDDPDAIMILVLELKHCRTYDVCGWAIGSEISERGEPSGSDHRPKFPAFEPHQLSPMWQLKRFIERPEVTTGGET